MKHFLPTALALAALLTACGSGSQDPMVPEVAKADAAGEVRLLALSNRADLVSGGDVLIELVSPAGLEATGARFDLNGRDVSDVFALRPNGRVQGLVSELALAANTLTATLPSGHGARLRLTNHPIGGPVFAGPQVQPWLCATEANGLGAAQDAQCNAPSVLTWHYVSSVTDAFAAYNPASPPSDVAMTTTTEGKTVPFIVRRERGTMDRGIYDIVVLTQPDEEFASWSPPAAWNGRVMISFGGGTAPKHMQSLPANTLNYHALGQGFLVAANGLHVHGNNTNDNVSAEALMMVKERVIEAYGPITHTIGTGCSGGGLQQYMLAAMYPGLLDGIIPTCSYADVWTTAMDVVDCSLMLSYYTNLSPHLWPAVPQRAQAEGHLNHSVCIAWEATFASRFDPGFANGCSLPQDQVYDADTNPAGTRCTIQDYQKAVWGPRPQDGFARRPFDNVGIQYGLAALEAGQILAEQFVDLNEKVGSKDIDNVIVPGRVTADAGSLEIAYRTSQVTDARQLASVPIIDLRGQDNEEIHTSYNSYVVRARLERDNGHHDNQIIWTGPVALAGDTAFLCGTNTAADTSDASCTHSPLLLMDRWLDAIAADASAGTLAQKIARNKPEDAVDTCFIGSQAITDAAVCGATYPYYASPRVVAGMPLTHDAIKCQLKPLNLADYSASFTDAQWTRMQVAFPDGVCDWSRPGVDQQASIPWMNFAAGPGGQPLPIAPVSVPFGPAIAAVAQAKDEGRFGSAAFAPWALLLLLAARSLRRNRRFH